LQGVLPLIALLAATGTSAPGLQPKSTPEWSEDQEVEERYSRDEEEEYIEYDPRDPRYLPWDEGEVPAGYVEGERIRVGWLITGIAVFAGLYAYTGLVFSLAEGDLHGTLLIPGIGPIIEAARGESGNTASDTILVLDGVFQAAAIAVAIWAVADPRKLFIRSDLAVTPLIGSDAGGLVLTASF
jgi:hypothetical protein